MSEIFDIEFRTGGQSSAVQAFEDTKLAALGAKQKVSVLGTELRKLQRSGTATAQKMEDVSRSMIRAKRSAAQLEVQATELAQKLDVQGATTVDVGRKWGELGGALGNVGAVFGTLSPQMQQAGTVLGQVGSASGALTTALGPVGVAIAAITTVAGIMIPILQDTDEELDNIGETAVSSASSIRDLAAAFHELNEEQVALSGLGGEQSAQALLDEAVDAGASVAAQRATQLEVLGRILGRRVDSASAALALFRAINDQNREIGARIQPTIDEAVEELSALSVRANEIRIRQEELRVAVDLGRTSDTTGESGTGRDPTPAPTPAPRRRGGRGRERVDEEEEFNQLRLQNEIRTAAEVQAVEEASVDFIIEQWRRALDASVGFDAERLEKRKTTIVAIEAKEQEAADRTRARERELFAERRAHAEQAKQDQENAAVRAQRAGEESAAQAQDLVLGVQGSMNALLGQTIGFLLDGDDLASEAFTAMLDQFLAATAVEYTIRAIAQAGLGIAAAATLNPAAAGHAAAAATFAVVAGLAGGASAAIPNVSSGAAGAPQQVQQSTPLGGGGNVTNNVTNLYATQAVFTQSERGEILSRSETAHRRERGRRRRRAG